MNRPHLRAVVDGETGELHTGCPRCEDVEVGDLENAQRRILKLEREVKALKADHVARREADPQRQIILGLIELWARVTKHPRANIYAGDRFDHIKARLREGYTPEQIELAIEGLGAFPFVGPAGRMRSGKPSQRHDRLGIALSGGEAVERFCNLGYQARKAYNEAKESAPATLPRPGADTGNEASDAPPD